jgi:hypothetical protein
VYELYANLTWVTLSVTNDDICATSALGQHVTTDIPKAGKTRLTMQRKDSTAESNTFQTNQQDFYTGGLH